MGLPLSIKARGSDISFWGDQGFAKAMQQANGQKVEALSTTLAPLSTPDLRGVSMGGGSDDIGDIMWTVPTVTIRYPSNIPNAIELQDNRG